MQTHFFRRTNTNALGQPRSWTDHLLWHHASRTVDLLILKALTAGALHGLGVSRRVDQITHGAFSVQPGSLFPALHRLEEAGWLAGAWNRRQDRDPLADGRGHP